MLSFLVGRFLPQYSSQFKISLSVFCVIAIGIVLLIEHRNLVSYWEDWRQVTMIRLKKLSEASENSQQDSGERRS